MPSVQLVDPWQESQYPGISDLETELRSWNWVYGKTPRFTVEKLVPVETKQTDSITLAVSVSKGKISGVTLHHDTTSKYIFNENIDQKHRVGHELGDFLLMLTSRLNQTLTGVEFRSQVISVYLANLANDTSWQTHSDNGKDLAKERMTIALTLFDHLADLCLQ